MHRQMGQLVKQESLRFTSLVQFVKWFDNEIYYNAIYTLYNCQLSPKHRICKIAQYIHFELLPIILHIGINNFEDHRILINIYKTQILVTKIFLNIKIKTSFIKLYFPNYYNHYITKLLYSKFRNSQVYINKLNTKETDMQRQNKRK